MGTGLYGPPWPGGKSESGGSRTGPWIASLLPYRGLYAEPFAGMLGVLLQRRLSPRELVNDLDGHVHNFWLAVRDECEELMRWFTLTPHARRSVDASNVALGDPSGLSSVEWAGHFMVRCYQAMGSYNANPGWARLLAKSGGSRLRDPRRIAERISAVAVRLRRVQLENRDALEVLDRLAPLKDSVIYVDPPYPSLNAGLYAETVDYDGLRDVLKRCKGFVAVSGYPGEWDALDWPERRERHVKSFMSHADEGNLPDRVEVLWANRMIEGMQTKLFG